MKRFYKKAAAAAQDGMFAVMLDGRPVRTPGRGFLHLPTQALAEAVAIEWEAQLETIEPATMPLTQLGSTALDRVAKQATAIAAEVARYAETDLVCYRAHGPETLVKRQDEVWTPLLTWLEDQYGAKLLVTAGIQPVPQPVAAIASVQKAVSAFGHFPLAGLSSATSASGSVVVGLALTTGRITGEQAAEAAFVDETYQMEQWGADALEEARQVQLRSDLAAVEHFLALLA